MISQVYLSKLSDDAWADTLVSEIWSKGYSVVSNFLSPEGFSAMMDFARKENVGNKKTGVLKGTMGYEFGYSDEFMTLFNLMHKARCKKEGKEYTPLKREQQRIGFPYKDARDGKKTEETEYHYDGAFMNATLALVMPESGGELIAFPNLRRSRYAFVPRVYSRALMYLPFLRRIVPHTVAKTVPNDLCLFFGDRTFHGVEPIYAGERLIMTINNHW